MSADALLAQLRQGGGRAAHRYGGQLRRLHQALCDPFEQETGIVLLGDSITWGSGLADNAPALPRGHSLADARDRFATRSWANEFKRAIGRDYFGGAAPTLSNWPAAVSGESTVAYARGVELYPGRAPFARASTGGAALTQEVACAEARLGYLYQCVDRGDGSSQTLSFDFTGTAFTLFFTSIAAHQPMDYEVIVGGVSQGVFATLDGTRHGLSRTHVFAYVRRQRIVIRAVRTGAAGVQHLAIEALRIDKTCRITNHGLIGINAKVCLERHCTAARMEGLCESDNFALIQFGSNDRSRIFAKYGQADGINTFAGNMQALVDHMGQHAAIVLMAGGPAADDGHDRTAFSMLDARNALDALASRAGVDLIDHYAVLQGFELAEVLADGLHPNELGHALIARNVLDALRCA